MITADFKPITRHENYKNLQYYMQDTLSPRYNETLGDFNRHEHFRRIQRHNKTRTLRKIQRHTKGMGYFNAIPSNELVVYHSNYLMTVSTESVIWLSNVSLKAVIRTKDVRSPAIPAICFTSDITARQCDRWDSMSNADWWGRLDSMSNADWWGRSDSMSNAD